MKAMKKTNEQNKGIPAVFLDRDGTIIEDRGYLSAYGITLLETYVCPHEHVSGCRCMKPNPYFLKKAERDFGIDLGRSFVIGDHPHDVELARNAGASAIYVLSGHGMKHRDELSRGTEVAGGIMEAVEIIRARVEASPDCRYRIPASSIPQHSDHWSVGR